MNAPWYNSLRIQILLLLTLALIPLGAVAIYQTNRVALEAERNADLALLALTGRAAKREELIIESASGAARFLATIIGDFMGDPARCATDLGQFVAQNDRYSFVGILPVSGQMTCSSTGESFDFSDWPGFSEAVAAQKRNLVANTGAPLSGDSVFILSEPFEIDGEFAGFVSISMPHSGLPDSTEDLAFLGLEELVTFTADGALLTARGDLRAAGFEFPIGIDPADLSVRTADAFHGKNLRGESRTYTVVPVEGSPVTVMGVWRVDDGLASRVAGIIRPSLFPVLMWFASMAVAMLSVYMLVLRHITRLRISMDKFTRDRSLSSIDTSASMPNELKALNLNFERMTQDILQDEASLENALREKNVLIKEVHHRVKNNLQLISSIMNMQIRTAEHDETRSVLSRLQDRVLSLARIHRDLYQSQNGGMIDVGALITDIVEKSLEVGLANETDAKLTTDIEPVLLFPDQAVPLSLMVAEGMTNTLKYTGAPQSERPWFAATLKQEGEFCTFTLANSVGGENLAESTGLGAQLIDAFAIQLGGKLETEAGEDSYIMRVRFKVQDFAPETRDY